MNRCATIVLATCLIAAGRGDDDNGAAPSSAPMVFTADLRPANEVPPVGNAEGGGSGTAQITISGNTATMYFQLTGFPAGTRVVGAHIHRGGPSVNGPVLVNTGVSGASPVLLSDRISQFSVSAVPVDAALVQEIANNPFGFYFNVHSPLNPGGFARGQLVRIQ